MERTIKDVLEDQAVETYEKMARDPIIALQIMELAAAETRIAVHTGLDVDNPETWVSWYIGSLAHSLAVQKMMPEARGTCQRVGHGVITVASYLYEEAKKKVFERE